MRSTLLAASVYGDEEIVRDVVGYGHIGDGNLHLNITAAKYDSKITSLIEPYVYEWTCKFSRVPASRILFSQQYSNMVFTTAKYKGSISAEHGLGLMKANHLHYSKSAAMIQVMKSIKHAFDANGIMNPYKVCFLN